jgi:hypothetical protein
MKYGTFAGTDGAGDNAHFPGGKEGIDVIQNNTGFAVSPGVDNT